jgi:hypothetical protein
MLFGVVIVPKSFLVFTLSSPLHALLNGGVFYGTSPWTGIGYAHPEVIGFPGNQRR